MTSPSTQFRFSKSDSPILHEAARSYREGAPRPNTVLYGFVRLLKRAEEEDDGTVGLSTKIDGLRRHVTSVLERADYETAVKAHGMRGPVVLAGDLERAGQRWRLLNPHITDVITDDQADDALSA